MAHRMREVPVLEVSSSDEGSSKDEGLSTTHTKKPLKLGKLRITDSLVVHHFIWQYELVNTAEGQPVIYDSISAPLFVSRYMQAMEVEKPAVRPYMANHLVDLIGNMQNSMAGSPSRLSMLLGYSNKSMAASC